MKEQCVHYYYIDSENLGTCRKCGNTRQFMSSSDLFTHLAKRRVYGRIIEDSVDYIPKETDLSEFVKTLT